MPGCQFLQALRPALDTGRTDFHGALLSATTPQGLSSALPGAERGVPILIAAMGPNALQVTGELADGVLPNLAGPRVLESRLVPTVLEEAHRAARPAPRIIAAVPVLVTDEPDRVRAIANSRMAFYDTVPSYAGVVAEEGLDHAADLALIGDEASVTAGLLRYRDAGATEIILTSTDLDGPQALRRTWELAGTLGTT